MTQPRVVVAEQIADAALAVLRESCEVDDASDASREELKGRLAEADAIVVRSATQVDADLMGAAPKLRVIGRAGIGVDNIDLS
ncbi:MAG: phosphoglycerate dehydrogenase, partial [Acidimicrobiia bacterium]